jgi:hypothetical protein
MAAFAVWDDIGPLIKWFQSEKEAKDTFHSILHSKPPRDRIFSLMWRVENGKCSDTTRGDKVVLENKVELPTPTKKRKTIVVDVSEEDDDSGQSPKKKTRHELLIDTENGDSDNGDSDSKREFVRQACFGIGNTIIPSGCF